MSEWRPNGYFVDRNGKRIEVVDAAARDGVAANAEAVGQLSEEMSEVKSSVWGNEKIATVTDEGSTETYYPASGVEKELSGAHTSPALPISGYQYLEYRGKITRDYYVLMFLDASGGVMLGEGIQADGGNDLKYYTGTIPVPAGAEYVRVTCYGATDGYVRAYNDSLMQRVSDIEKGVLHGKRIAFLGDSITSTNYTTPNYWQKIAEKTGCEGLNYGVSQSRFATVEGDVAPSFVTRAAAMDVTADAVFVMGGTNDVGKHSMLGEWDSTDESTFYGGLNALLSLLRTMYPGKPIVFATPMKRLSDIDNGFPDMMADLKAASADEQITMQHCVLAIKAKCARAGIPVVDIAEHSGIGAGCAEYFLPDDNLHPSALGEIRIANMVQDELEKQFQHMTD